LVVHVELMYKWTGFDKITIAPVEVGQKINSSGFTQGQLGIPEW
jgi:hypothetical protein